MSPKRTKLGKGWPGLLFVSFVAIATAIVVIAQPVVGNAGDVIVLDKDGKPQIDLKTNAPKKMHVAVDSHNEVLGVFLDGKLLQSAKGENDYPIKLGPSSNKEIWLIEPGPPPVVVMGASCCCYLIGGKWYPVPNDGHTCP